ncbi:hypothetical protein [Pseudonocardia sp. TRM90224]|uniref:hypothetical protein n=1 Tax=Pseudonocardia sp. TRM90224 TaxID=2812678 RepID=UPI001E3FE71F|nr:hypothetical protein [Pseudonocardia sp. TRM90224]
MRIRLRTAGLLAIAGTLATGSFSPAAAETAATTSWSPDLGAGEAAGISVVAGAATLDPDDTYLAPVDDGTHAEGDPAAASTGLLTLPAQQLARATDRVRASIGGDVPPGTSAVVDIRGKRQLGGWTEWVPVANDAVAQLPEPSSRVQGRLVLTGDGAAMPTVRDVTLTAIESERARSEAPTPAKEMLNYRVFATREGLAGGRTANGHTIAERDHFVALPSRRALAPRNTSDYSVKVCAPTGRCAFAPVWDVGPWNTRDDYWNPPGQRQEWGDLPQGLPQAQAAFDDGHNGGRDQYDREVKNPAGIDLGDGLFWDALGLKNNAWVTVDYLWTGPLRLSKVAGEEPVDVLAAPDAAAKVVGVAAAKAAVPVECLLTSAAGKWLRIGTDQYVAAEAVPDAGDVEVCNAAA